MFSKPPFCTKKNLKQAGSDFIWFQLHDNTIWALAFRSEQIRNSKAYKLPDGRHIIALEDKAVSTPLYQIESITPSDITVNLITDKKTKKTTQSDNNESIVKWGHVNTGSWMLSGNFTSFKVPESYFSERRLIYVEYNYQWEMDGTIFSESGGPKHKAYTWIDLEDSKANWCVS